MHLAADEGETAICQLLLLLLSYGAAVDAPDHEEGQTAFMLAFGHGYVDTCEVLLRYGARRWIFEDPNQDDVALTVACVEENEALCELLLQHGAPIPEHPSAWDI